MRATSTHQKCLLVALQLAARSGRADKANNFAIFDNVDVKQYYCWIDGIKYPRDSIHVHYAKNNCLDQYGYLKGYYKNYVGAPLLDPIISFVNMKSF